MTYAQWASQPRAARPAPWWDQAAVYRRCDEREAEIVMVATYEVCGVGDVHREELPLRRLRPGESFSDSLNYFSACMYNDPERDIVGGGFGGSVNVDDTATPGITMHFLLHWELGRASKGEVDKRLTIVIGRPDTYVLAPNCG